VLGAVFGGLLLDPMLRVTKGRRKTNIWASVITVTGAGCMCILNIWAIAIFKFIYGLGAGLTLASSILYI